MSMDFSWIDALMRDYENKKNKSRRQENKTVSKRIRRINKSKSLRQHQFMYLSNRSK